MDPLTPPPSDEEERRPYFSEVSPDERAPDERRRITPGAVAGGVVTGLVLAFVYFIFALGTPGTTGGAFAVTAAALPVVVGVALLLVPGLRRAGSGLVMGMAIGAIIFAGLCGSVFVGPV